MTRIELQTKAYTDISRYLETVDVLKVHIGNIPGSISFWPDYESAVCLDAFQSYVDTFYEYLEEYVHTYMSNVTVEYGEECIRLTF